MTPHGGKSELELDMMRQPIPLVILAGGVKQAPVLPASGAGKHALSGAKGIDIELRGRPLIDHLTERLRASGGFDPIYIAGPTSAYGRERDGCEVIDTDGSLGENVARCVEHAGQRHPGVSIAIITCDILPEVDELRTLLDEYWSHAPCDFWFGLIRTPSDLRELGASAWKPRYRVVEAATGEVHEILPGHLTVVYTEALYLPLTLACFDVAYRSRNRRVLYRLRLMIQKVLLLLLTDDLRLLLRLRLPRRTVTALGNGIRLALRLRDGRLSEVEMGERLRRIYFQYDHRRVHPEWRGRLPLVEGLSLAKDIDTREEAEEQDLRLAEQDEGQEP